MLRDQLLDLGVVPGGVVGRAHGVLEGFGPVEGGPEGLIAALRAALGADGTLVMPSMSDSDEHVFDPATTPCAGMGIVAETFWRLPGVLRSDSPHAFAAVGPAAAAITAPHPIDVPHGPNSPPGRVHERDGQVLLLGVGHDADTTSTWRRSWRPFATGGRSGRWSCATASRSATTTTRSTTAASASRWSTAGWTRSSFSGAARSATPRPAWPRARDIVRVVIARLRQDETAFLHPPGVDVECDEARASLERRR